MARPLRIDVPGGWYHVTARGKERRAIYLDDRDRERLVGLLAELPGRFGARVHAYVLTTTKTYDALQRLTDIRTFNAQHSTLNAHRYDYNTANQRTRRTEADGSYWDYTYDALGQVTSGVRKWSDGALVAGQQYEYAFDDIGNRKQSGIGVPPVQSVYTANALNQYTQRTVPGYVWELGSAHSNATVTINNQPVARKGEYFAREIGVANSATALYTQLTTVAVLKNAGSNQMDIVSTVTGKVYVAKSPELFGYDADGNLTNDGRFAYVWDGENRLIQAQTLDNLPATVPRQKLLFGYDHQSRRVSKVVSNYVTGSWLLTSDSRFIYDGWNLLAELNTTNGLLRSYTWGLDLSGTEQGAGGIGGLLFLRAPRPLGEGSGEGAYACAFDGNGNVSALLDMRTGQVAAEYEYSPFGELIRATGPLAKTNPFRFSTKYQDDETGLLYYGYRYYQPSTGRWPSRDPIGEWGGLNLYGFVGNDPIDYFDELGLACSWAVGVCVRNIGNVQVPDTVTINGKTFNIPQWVKKAVSAAVPDHHDVKVESYAGTKCAGTIEETIVRGFFADSFGDAIAHFAASYIPKSGVDGYVPGGVKDSASTAGPCSLSCVDKARFDTVKQRITTSTASKYHLTKYNCQKWAAEQLK